MKATGVDLAFENRKYSFTVDGIEGILDIKKENH
jgi:hypothetical protein